MFRTIAERIERDPDYPLRHYTLDLLQRVLDGTIYDVLPHPFHQEKDEQENYIRLRDRRPCVRWAVHRIVVDDSVSLLFSEGHFPKVHSEDEAVALALPEVCKSLRLNEVMVDAATIGSVGSVALFLRILADKKGNPAKPTFRPFVEVKSTEYLTPIWDATNPHRLEKVIEQYKISGQELRDSGYVEIAEDDARTDYWFRREWTEAEEIWFKPWKVRAQQGEGQSEPVRDEARTVTHDLGFVPWVWIRNLPGRLKLFDFQPVGRRGEGMARRYSEIDGDCTFLAAIETAIEIDYQLSQAGRGLKYWSDPTLVLKEPGVDSDGELARNPGNAIVVDAEGDAKLLEIDGNGALAVLDFVRELRKLALESIHGNRADADKLSAAQSGRAMELLNQALIWLADRLRISYGDNGLLALVRLVLRAHAKMPLTLGEAEAPLPALNAKADLLLQWPSWYQPTADDKQKEASTLGSLTQHGIMSEDTATRVMAPSYDIEDPDGERQQIEVEHVKQRAEVIEDAKATAQIPQTPAA